MSEVPPRDRILNTVVELLETQGYYATGLNEIVAISGAPKGSVYHYFPGGKEEIAAEAIERKGHQVALHIRQHLAAYDDPAEAVRQMIYAMTHHMRVHQCVRGGPLATVALETAATSDHLRQVCQQAYALWRNAFLDKLADSGYPPERAESLATLIVASIEGGVILSRASQDTAYLEQIADTLARVIRLEGP